ncbi:MAG TPA: Ig-like domain-containing protein, partial [Pirellulaceae bacterium]|nr:Ig-like domain-containing protein [Pirellulaceae bacterium]
TTDAFASSVTVSGVTFSVAANGKSIEFPANTTNIFGNFTFEYQVNDLTNDGGTLGDLSDDPVADVGLVTIAITGVNDNPEFTSPASLPDVAEDSNGASSAVGSRTYVIPNFLTGISAGQYENAGRPVTDPFGTQTVSFVVNIVNPAMSPIASATIAANGTLTYTLKPDANGAASFTVTATDTATGTTTSAPVSLTVTPVDDAPIFALPNTEANPLSVVEDGSNLVVVSRGAFEFDNFASGRATGPATATDELASQSLVNFTVTADDPSLFDVLPAIDVNTGKLTFELKDDVFGETIIRVTLTDNGTGSAAQVTSAEKTFKLVVRPVNDQPTFDVSGVSPTTAEADAPAAQSVAGFASNIVVGPANEQAAQNLSRTFAVTVTGISTAGMTAADFFSQAPAIDINGNLTYTVKPDAYGTVSLSVVLNDQGGTTDGGVQTSTAHTFQIVVTGVNDAPTLSIPTNATTVESLTPAVVTVPNFAVISAGPFEPISEVNSPQAAVLVSASPTLTFEQAPTVSRDGTLTYKVNPNAYGTASFTLQVSDAGGQSSAVVPFTITVTAVNNTPAFAVPATTPVSEDNSATPLNPSSPTTVTLPDFFTGVDLGALENPADGGLVSEGGSQTLTFAFTVTDPSGVLNGTPTVAAGTTATDRNLNFQLKPNKSGTVTITVVGTDNPTVGTPATFSRTFTLNVGAVNDAPPAVNEPTAIRVFKTQDHQDVLLSALLANENAPGVNVDSGETLSITAVTVITPSGGFPVGQVPTVTLDAANGKLVFRPNGYIGQVEVEYTISDGNPTPTSAARVTFDVVDFLPGTISGLVFNDSNGSGTMDPASGYYQAERGLSGIDVFLTGNTMFLGSNDPNLEDLDPVAAGVQRVIKVTTDAQGKYTFPSVIPGTYTISLDDPRTPAVESPAMLINGDDVVREVNANPALTKITRPAIGATYQVVDPLDPTHITSVTHTANNTFKVVFDERGTDLKLDFLFGGVTSSFVNITDHLATSTTNGATFAINKGASGAQQQYWFSGMDGWSGSNFLLSIDAQNKVQLSWDDGTLTHFVELDTQVDWMKVRIMGTSGNLVYVRLVGTLSQFMQHPSHATVPQITGDELAYANAVDNYFATH